MWIGKILIIAQKIDFKPKFSNTRLIVKFRFRRTITCLNPSFLTFQLNRFRFSSGLFTVGSLVSSFCCRVPYTYEECIPLKSVHTLTASRKQ